MNRILGKTKFNINPIGLGTWQVGGKWGSGFDHKLANTILHKAVDRGVNFIDTADVYESGESEKAVGRFCKERSEDLFVATKCGRQLNPHNNENYTPEALRNFVEESLKRLERETIDLIQLHCPPTEVYYRPEIFGLFERLKEEGKIRYLGVSVEKVEEGLKAIEFDNVCSVQIIYNMFRQRPDDIFFQRAKQKDVGIIVRVPLASGLLTGGYHSDTKFEKDDHRFFNRNGAGFDRGETFSGIDYETGLKAVAQLKGLFPNHENLAPIALKWVLMNKLVSVIIPGASKEHQVSSNMLALQTEALTEAKLIGINNIYNELIKASVHPFW